MAGSKVRAPAAVAAALTLALGIGACGDDDGGGGGSSEGGGGGGGGKIALLLPETKTTRYEEQDRPNFERRVRELCADCEVIYSNADQDPAKQQQQAEAAMDAIEESGADSPKVVMINGAPTDSNAKPYKDGASQVLKERGAQIVKSYDTPDWSPDKAQQEMEASITGLGKDGFDAVYVANDGMAGGAIAALKGANIDPKSRFVTGQDAELAGVQRILSGEQLMTVYQPIIDIAETAAELAVPIAQGKQPPADLAADKVDNGAKQVPSVLLDTIAIQEGNIEDPLIKEGFLDAGKICTKAYAKECQEAGIK